MSSSNYTHLENVLVWIRYFLPCIHQVLVPFPHDEIQILIRFPGDHTVVNDSLLVVPECTPTISVNSLQQREGRSIES